ncbi:3'-5' exonuclease [Arsukibacterium perlucidum]|uniref:3'-5' exonuclease n=1 Tax=Arsukibacterium perlucidum TaxID=368811 RepID=UPI00037A433A|nr:3'-5' exonuclease [Arsukibacterium perlucidum]
MMINVPLLLETHLRFIAFDLELTCERDVPEYPHQIIEVGAVLCGGGKIIDEFQSYVQPMSDYELTQFCSELTGITKKQLADAPTIQHVAATFGQFISDSKPELIISWGQGDRDILATECTAADIAYPLSGFEYQNFKKEFCKQRKIKRVGLKTALQICGITLEGRQHSAVSDAANLARLFNYTLNNRMS